MIRNLKPVFAAGLAAWSTCALAWFDSGHMVVAEIAYGRLKPSVKAEADRLLKIGGTDRTGDFITAACWADDIRRDRRETAPWHYIDLHFRQDGKTDFNPPEDENVVWAIHKFEKVLANRDSPDADRADALRFILHFVGDVHQPLHATSRDTDAMPKGDAGGNRFRIEPPDLLASESRPPHNLHALWDQACGFLPSGGLNRPLSDSGFQEVRQLAQQVQAAYPLKSLSQAGNLDPITWANESFAQDERFVYTLPDGSKPTQAYIREGQEISKKRLALAGYRLAELLNKLL